MQGGGEFALQLSKTGGDGDDAERESQELEGGVDVGAACADVGARWRRATSPWNAQCMRR